MEIVYRPGKKQGHFDAISRCQNPKHCDCEDVDMSEVFNCGPCKKSQKRAKDMVLTVNDDGKEITRALTGTTKLKVIPKTKTKPKFSWADGRSIEDMRRLQEEDDDIGPVLFAKKNDIIPSQQEALNMSTASRLYLLLWNMLKVKDGILFKWYVQKNQCGRYLQFIVPQTLREELKQCHDSIISGHLGLKKTHEKTMKRFYWFFMKTDVRLYLRSCYVCAAEKTPQKLPKAIQTCAPFKVVATDYIGPFPLTPRATSTFWLSLTSPLNTLKF